MTDYDFNPLTQDGVNALALVLGLNADIEEHRKFMYNVVGRFRSYLSSYWAPFAAKNILRAELSGGSRQYTDMEIEERFIKTETPQYKSALGKATKYLTEEPNARTLLTLLNIIGKYVKPDDITRDKYERAITSPITRNICVLNIGDYDKIQSAVGSRFSDLLTVAESYLEGIDSRRYSDIVSAVYGPQLNGTRNDGFRYIVADVRRKQ